MLTFTLCVWAAAAAYMILAIYRLNRFYKFMGKEIDRVFEARIRGGRDAAYWPDVNKCYDNFKWYKLFDFNFQRMMVYDHTR